MHWMQRIHHPTARKQRIDEGYQLRSGDIAYRKRRVSIIVRFLFDGEFKVRLSLDPPGARRIGMPPTAGLVPPKSQNARFVLPLIAVELTSSLLSALWPLPTRSAKVRNPPN